jgi:type II secretory pathway component PulC
MANLPINLLALFNEQWRRSMILFVNALLLLVLLGTLVYQSQAIITLLKVKSVSGNSKNVAIVTVDRTVKNGEITQWHLFGVQEILAPVAIYTKWMLRGIILGDQPENNVAFIASSDADEASYRRGDKLADGTIIFNILSDKVLLNHNGIIETLFIPWNTEDHSTISSPNNPVSSGSAYNHEGNG